MEVKIFMDTAYQMFTSYGIMAVSKKDIEARCGIKLKWLKKDDILTDCVLRLENELLAKMEPVISEGTEEPLAKLIRLYEECFGFVQNIHPAFFLDLQRHHPYQSEHLKKAITDKVIQPYVASLLIKAQKKGLLPDDLDTEKEYQHHCLILKNLWKQTDDFPSRSPNPLQLRDQFRKRYKCELP